MKREAILKQVDCGGSPECILAYAKRGCLCFLLVVLFTGLVGCESGESQLTTGSTDVAVRAVSPSVGQVYRHTHIEEGCTFTVGEYIPGEPVMTGGIRINGSAQFQVVIDSDEFTTQIANNPDWTLDTDCFEILHR